MILNIAQTWVQNTPPQMWGIRIMKCHESGVLRLIQAPSAKQSDACFTKAAGCVKVSQKKKKKTVRQKRIINGHGSAPIVSIFG